MPILDPSRSSLRLPLRNPPDAMVGDPELPAQAMLDFDVEYGIELSAVVEPSTFRPVSAGPTGGRYPVRPEGVSDRV